LIALIGDHNKTSYSIQELNAQPQSRRYIADMHGKYANMCGDIGCKRIEANDNIKKLTGGDPVTGQRMYEGAFDFVNFAKIIVALNKLPKKDAFTTGDKRRDLTIEFKGRIVDTNDQILDLDKIIKASGEMPGILNWALDGLKRLEENQDFTGVPSIAERGMDYERKSNPTMYFVEECLVEHYGEYTLIMVLYEKYSTYRKLHGMPELSSKELINGIMYYCKQLNWGVSRRQEKQADGTRPIILTNVQLIEVYDEQEHEREERNRIKNISSTTQGDKDHPFFDKFESNQQI